MPAESEKQPTITTERIIWFTVIGVTILNLLAGGSMRLVIRHVGRFLLIAYFYLMPHKLIVNELARVPDDSVQAQALRALAGAWIAGIPAFLFYRFIGNANTTRLPVIISLPLPFVVFFVVNLNAKQGGFRIEHWEYVRDIPSKLYHACMDDNRCPHGLLWEETKRTFMEWRLGDTAAQALREDLFGTANM